jgi:hypothetical protein
VVGITELGYIYVVYNSYVHGNALRIELFTSLCCYFEMFGIRILGYVL